MEILESFYQLDKELSNLAFSVGKKAPTLDSLKRMVFDWMKENKVEDILLGFSGGNDEGDVDRGVLVMDDATDLDIDISKLSDFLASPIFKEYGSFAGDFYVDGTLSWLASGKVLLDGKEV